jgi:hypothetical protein
MADDSHSSDPDPLPADLAAATPEEITEALSYALRYDERGRPRPSGGQLVASLAAERLMAHLTRAGFIILKRPAARPHSAG